MLPLSSKILFFVFALVTGVIGVWGFYRLYLRIRRGRPAEETRVDRPGARLLYALRTTLTQERTFRRRTAISVLHSFIFYGFVYYLLVNVIDGLEGYFAFSITSGNPLGALYNLLSDILSFLVLLGVLSLVVRRLFLPARRDFVFNARTLLHPLVKQQFILRDSLIVSAFITFHVGSRIIGQAAKLAEEGSDRWQPFTSTVSGWLFSGASDAAVHGWRVFGYWGALGSVLAFLAYFPYTKHIHIFMAPVNYFLRRPVNSGTLPPMKGLAEAMEQEEPQLGASQLEDLSWPRLLDAYACIQCNRCQDVCPGSATGKSLSPAALEINKRMELNMLASHASPFKLQTAAFEGGAATAQPLLEFAISEEAVWACTTCGACMQVCPVQDEQMLDIIDIRRQQVMVAGEFPAQLQTAFRGMERASNPWGISRDKRMEWAEGLKVPTIDENPTPDVLYWVGCAASYDPGAQKVARSFVQLLDRAGVNYAVLGKKEACTGDSARRAGNEFLYQQLAEENVATLNEVRPKLIVATCPHCMNMIGNEYPQLGGHYQTMHHTQYLEMLVQGGQLQADPLEANVTYHDPCYLGRHNGVYDAPRSVIQSMGNQILELERSREGSFCCGAGGAQFWKEEEEGDGRISDNRFNEIQARLDAATENAKAGKVVAVGCPFCKSMLNSSPGKQSRDDIVIKDVAELLLEGVQRRQGEPVPTSPVPDPVGEGSGPHTEGIAVPNAELPVAQGRGEVNADLPGTVVGETTAEVANDQPPAPAAPRKAWKPKSQDDVVSEPPAEADIPAPAPAARKAWNPKGTGDDVVPTPATEEPAPAPRKAWTPKAAPAAAEATPPATVPDASAEAPSSTPIAPVQRKAWTPKAAAPAAPAPAEPEPSPVAPEPAPSGERRKWAPKTATAAATPAVSPASPITEAEPAETATPPRPKWTPAARAASPAETAPAPEAAAAEAPTEPDQPSPETGRKKWTPKKG
ncbi:(Fe-S)-binding protein [Deinococcus sonorensis]|uniref:Heterodisulfide reductase-related iron-sulfur binding cluster n=2 Tax=Deinococcus sonorensis TaxID=309891 RepID=A0AAU7UAD2_9DEIO